MDILVNNIMKNYPNGVIDLITAEKPKESEPQIILLFNAPLWFCKRYGIRQPQDNKKSLLNLDIIKPIIIFDNFNNFSVSTQIDY